MASPLDHIDAATDATSTPMDLSWRVERNPSAATSPQPMSTDPSKVQMKKRKLGETATIYICPICNRELPTLTAFIEHMATHHHRLPDACSERVADEPLPAVKEESAFAQSSDDKRRDCQKCQQVVRKGTQNSSHRRLARDIRNHDLEQQQTREQEDSATITMAASIAAEYEECPRICLACPQRAAFTCMEEALAHFETHHVHSVAICSLCGLWFTSKSLFAAHAMEAHVRRTGRAVSPRRTGWITGDRLRDAASSLSESNFLDPVVASILLSGLLLSSSSQTLRLLPYIRDSFASTADTLPRKPQATAGAREASEAVRPISSPKPIEQRSDEGVPAPTGSLTRSSVLEVKATSRSPPRERVKPQATPPSDALSASPREVSSDPQNCRMLEPSTARTIPLLLFDHPIQRLLPPHVAVAIDRRTVAKMCHICFKEFPDEMTVLKHQVLEHKFDENQEADKTEQKCKSERFDSSPI